MTTVKTKDGEQEVFGAVPGELLGAAPQPRKANRISGEVTFTDHEGRTVKLRPTFEAALEIEDALGGLNNLNMRVRAGGVPGIPSIPFREQGVLIAAGVRAAGEERVDAAKAARFAYECGWARLQKPLTEFIRAMVDGGRLREDDLKNAESSNGWRSESDAAALFEDLTGATRSGDTSASPS